MKQNEVKPCTHGRTQSVVLALCAVWFKTHSCPVKGRLGRDAFYFCMQFKSSHEVLFISKALQLGIYLFL